MARSEKGKHDISSATPSSGGGRALVVLSLILILSGIGLSAAARMIPGFAEWYAVTAYPIWQGSLGRFSGLFPFSLSEMLCALLPVLIIADIIIFRHRLRKSAAHFLILIALLFFLYSANCGVNYYRDAFVPEELSAEASFTEDQLGEFCGFIVSKLEQCYSDNGDTQYPDAGTLAETARDSMISLSEDYPSLAGFYPRPKQLTFMSRFFSMMGVSGIYSPFTIEANVNGEMEGMEKPFTSCHELSHLRGYMNEGEANFIGWLACISSDDPSFRRSGWLIAWIYAGNSLGRIDPELRSEIAEKLPDSAVRELELNNQFWATHENGASEIQDHVNDAYLKSNGQAEGIQTYGHLTTLMLMWYTGEFSPHSMTH